MDKIFFPENIIEILSEYQETEHQRIKERYKTLYENEIDRIKEFVKERFNNNIYDHYSHCRVLTSILAPFVSQKIENFELLYIEPLLYLRNNKAIPEDTPIWDFLLAEINQSRLIRLILGEVKTQKARTGMDRVEEAVKLYSKTEILNKLYDYIEKLFKDKDIKFKRNNVQIENVLVVQSLYYEDYEQSVIERGLRVNIWEIDPDILRSKYTIKIHRWDKLFNEKDIYSEVDQTYLHMLSFLRSRTFKDEEFLSFTYASDLNLVLDLLYKSYVNLYGISYFDSNLINLINQAGGGNFYDDNKVIPNLVAKIKELFLNYKSIKKEGTQEIFKQRIDIKNRILNNRLKGEIERGVGIELIQQAINDLNPKRAPRRVNLDKWLNYDKEKID